MTLKMKLIVAMDAECGIGKNGGLPWRLKRDMKWFAEKTKQVNDDSKKNAVLMGRKCWESIPENRRPLPGRLNIVLSRSLTPKNEKDLIITNDINNLENLLDQHDIETIWNIGGAEIYSLALRNNWVEEIYCTNIHQTFDTDVKLDAIDWKMFNKQPNEDHFEENGVEFTFNRWIRN